MIIALGLVHHHSDMTMLSFMSTTPLTSHPRVREIWRTRTLKLPERSTERNAVAPPKLATIATPEASDVSPLTMASHVKTAIVLTSHVHITGSLAEEVPSLAILVGHHRVSPETGESRSSKTSRLISAPRPRDGVHRSSKAPGTLHTSPAKRLSWI